MALKTSEKALNTLCIDVGGTGVKIMLLDSSGKPLTERLRLPTPEDPTPTRVLAAVEKLKALGCAIRSVSQVSFPRVVGLRRHRHRRKPPS